MVFPRIGSLRISVASILLLTILALFIFPVAAQEAGDTSWLSVDKVDWHSTNKRFSNTETSITRIQPTLTITNHKTETATITKVELYFNPEMSGKFSWEGSETAASGASVDITIRMEIDKSQNTGDRNVMARVLVTYSGVEYEIDIGRIDTITIYRASGGIPGFPWESIAAGLAIAVIVLVSRRRTIRVPIRP
jgi:hypothetical protein